MVTVQYTIQKPAANTIQDIKFKLTLLYFYVIKTWWLSLHDVGHINEVTLRQTQLVLRRVITHACDILIYIQPLRPTQPPTLSGTGNEYRSRSRGWLGSREVSMLDSGAEGPGFKSQPRCCRVTVLGKLFTPIVPLFTKQRNWYQPS